MIKPLFAILFIGGKGGRKRINVLDLAGRRKGSVLPEKSGRLPRGKTDKIARHLPDEMSENVGGFGKRLRLSNGNIPSREHRKKDAKLRFGETPFRIRKFI